MTTSAHSTLDTAADQHAPFVEASSAPGSPATGLYWLNTTTMVISRYSGSAWVEVSPTVPQLLPSVLPVYADGDLIDPWVGVVSGTPFGAAGFTANQSWAVPIYLAKNVDLDGWALYITSAAASGKKAKAALFNPDGTTGLPSTKIMDCGEIATDATGLIQGSFTQTAFARGFYWLAVCANDAFNTFAVGTPTSTPIPYALNTAAAKSCVRVPVNYVNEFASTWNWDNQTVAYGGEAWRFAVRVAI
jgi:hypothetical protein